MTEPWRFIQNGFNNASANMAIDEAILISRTQGSVPNTIRFYQWKPSAVSLGFSQQAEKEIDIRTCRSLGIEIVRRPTGGGAVYHDSNGELTYSIVVDMEEVPYDLISSYGRLCHGIILACRELGLEAQLSVDETGRRCPNITVSRKKISGGAQTRRGKILLQHGTLLVDSNLDIMTKILKMGRPSACMPLDRLQSKVTTLRSILGRPISHYEIADSLRRGFEQALNVNLLKQDLTSDELKIASELCVRKYDTDEWNFKR